MAEALNAADHLNENFEANPASCPMPAESAV